MKRSIFLQASLVAIAMYGWSSLANADSSDATCEVRKDGDTRKEASGPCTFSQRQGYIDINLRNGDKYSLSPGSKANHYKDQKGTKVVRTQAGGNSQEFKWEGGKKILVTFVAASHQGYAAAPASRVDDTATGLSDLVGAKAGQAEGELERRGYVYARGSTAGNDKYSAWFNRSTGKCVMIRTSEGRYQSIVQTPPADCGR